MSGLADAFRRRAANAREAAATTAASQVDVEIERARAEAWSEAARLADIAAETSRDAKTAPVPADPPPPAGSMFRTGNGWMWCDRGDPRYADYLGTSVVVYVGVSPTGATGTADWGRIAAGEFGPVELLVPVPYTGAVDTPAGRYLAETVLNPVAAMMVQLAQAAGAGVTAVVADVYRQGVADAQGVR